MGPPPPPAKQGAHRAPRWLVNSSDCNPRQLLLEYRQIPRQICLECEQVLCQIFEGLIWYIFHHIFETPDKKSERGSRGRFCVRFF